MVALHTLWMCCQIWYSVEKLLPLPSIFSKAMAQHASSKKRIRQTETLREANRYYKKSTRTAIKKLREMTAKKEAAEYLPKVVSMIDKLVRRNSWHKNKAANLKSSLTQHVAALS
jgi:small subunit ribosomal protein S20